jgi:hypothetical protein
VKKLTQVTMSGLGIDLVHESDSADSPLDVPRLLVLRGVHLICYVLRNFAFFAAKLDPVQVQSLPQGVGCLVKDGAFSFCSSEPENLPFRH